MPNILIADDDVSNRSLLRTIAERVGKAIEVSNGEEAIAVMKKQKISLVLADNIMQPTGGEEVAEVAMKARMPYLIITATPDSVSERHKKHTVAKPCSATELEKKIYERSHPCAFAMYYTQA
ncbi:response regulator [Candidatus Woesearchaeota archaeon]|nr:response regulator [Candidatus Woesearchaeota archaeon]